MTLLRGLDISEHQGDVDFKRVRAAGYVFVIVKCSEGADFVDRFWSKKRVDAIREAKLFLFPYHYLRPRRDRLGSVEARHAYQVATQAGWRPGRLGVWTRRQGPMVIDVERGSNEVELAHMSGAQLWEYTSDFCDVIQRRSRRGCVSYLSPGFSVELGNRAPRNGQSAYVAEWDAVDGVPHVPAGFKRRWIRFHQTADNGQVPGVTEPVDLDVFLGGHLQLRALAGGVSLPSPKPPPLPPAPPANMSTRNVQRNLHRIGWPLRVDGVRGPRTRQAILDFQRGFSHRTLSVDGLVGDKTADAIRWSVSHDGRCSEHFRFREFADHQTGWIKTHRDLVRGLERLRHARGDRPVGILSGYRDPSRRIGAAKSMHHYGAAMDPTDPLGPPKPIAALRVFSGIGVGANGQVRHVDVRGAAGVPNFTGGTPDHPIIFADNF